MADDTIRAALNAAAAGWCATPDNPCHQCRSAARDLILEFLGNLPVLTVTSPLELRLRIAREGSDG